MDQQETRSAATLAVLAAKREAGLGFTEIAERVGRPRVWLTAAILGQHPFDEESATALQELLGLDDGTTAALREIPWRGSFAPTGPPTDPTVYRLYEAVQVYGPALKALIHEEWGDGIMSAINFEVDISRHEQDGEDRVRIVLDGKFLPYKW
jgi:cyanate lyase